MEKTKATHEIERFFLKGSNTATWGDREIDSRSMLVSFRKNERAPFPGFSSVSGVNNSKIQSGQIRV